VVGEGETCQNPDQLPIQRLPRALSPQVKRTGREVEHSPQSSVDVKNAYSCTSTPPYALILWCLIKHRDNFTF